MSLSVNAADAAAETEIASGAKDLTNSETLPESKKAEVVQQIDPNDPLQHFNQPYYRHRRRVQSSLPLEWRWARKARRHSDH